MLPRTRSRASPGRTARRRPPTCSARCCARAALDVRGRGQRRPAAVGARRPGRRRTTWIACELSSFQLEDIDRLRCRVGVILNVTPDHLDRHGSIDGVPALQAAHPREPGRRRHRRPERRRPGAARRASCPARGERVVVHRPPTRARSTGSTPGCAASTTSRTRSRPRPPPGRPASSDAAIDRRPARVRPAAAPARAGRRGRRRRVRERLQGHQPRRDHQGADGVSPAAST